MIFQMQIKTTETSAKIYAVKSRVLVALLSSVNQETTKFAPTNIGQMRKQMIIVYHQWIYSFMKSQKYQTNMMTVATR